MWKRTDADRPTPADSVTDRTDRPMPQPTRPPAPTASARESEHGGIPSIGQHVSIKGELTGKEDFVIAGHVEGVINLHAHELTIATTAKITAQITARSVIVLGQVAGDVTATERIDIRQGGSIDGDITTPAVAIAEGAHFRGRIDMSDATRSQDARTATGHGAARSTPSPPKQPAVTSQAASTR